MLNQTIRELGFESQQQYSFPNIVNVCVIRGDCPCQCIHCPIGTTSPYERHKKFGNTSISIELFRKIVQEMSNFQHSTLRIHGVGEPLLWKALLDALIIALRYNIRTWLFTCLLTDDLRLLEHITTFCNIIEISINSFDRENYEKTKGIDAFLFVKRNVKFLKKIVKSRNLSTRIIVSRVESKDKAYDSDFVEYWKKSDLVDDAFIRTYHDYNTLLENKFQRKRKRIIPCLVHWSRFNIDCDGTAVICFNELFKGHHPDKSLYLGNIIDQPIREIWHCEKLNLLRKAQLEKDYSIIDFTDKLPCIDCYSCQPLYGKNFTSESQIESLMES